LAAVEKAHHESAAHGHHEEHEQVDYYNQY
jgi:hypothetical protein